MNVTSQTRLYCVFGDPIEHSLSPTMQNAAIGRLGIDAVYMAFRVSLSGLVVALKGAMAMGVRGVNLTIPLKERGYELMDEVVGEARILGAVNTVVNEGGRMIGYNTDVAGFVNSLREELGISPSGLRTCLIGSGGAARGVAAGLAAGGAKSVTLLCRTMAKGESIASMISGHYRGCSTSVVGLSTPGASTAIAGADLIVNTTPLGMYPRVDEAPPIDWSSVRPSTAVADLIYNPVETRFLSTARQIGCPTMSGLGMLAHQGAAALRIWTGELPDITVMKNALRLRLAGGGCSC